MNQQKKKRMARKRNRNSERVNSTVTSLLSKALIVLKADANSRKAESDYLEADNELENALALANSNIPVKIESFDEDLEIKQIMACSD